MPDNRFAHSFGLILGPAMLLQEIQGQDAAMELEGQVRRVEVFVRGADVVKKEGQCDGGGRDGLGVLRELLLDDGRGFFVLVRPNDKMRGGGMP